MVLEQLVDAARVLQGHVPQGVAVLIGLVLPAVLIIAEGLGVVAGEQSVFEPETVLNDERGIGVVGDVILLNQIVLQHIIDQTAHEGDVCARTQLGVEVRLRRGPGVAGIDADQLGAVVHRPFHVLEGNGMVLSRI